MDKDKVMFADDEYPSTFISGAKENEHSYEGLPDMFLERHTVPKFDAWHLSLAVMRRQKSFTFLQAPAFTFTEQDVLAIDTGYSTGHGWFQREKLLLTWPPRRYVTFYNRAPGVLPIVSIGNGQCLITSSGHLQGVIKHRLICGCVICKK